MSEVTHSVTELVLDDHHPHSPQAYKEMKEIERGRYNDITFTAEELRIIKISMQRMSTGVFATLPMICLNDSCPQKGDCPLYEIGKAPTGRRCHPPGTLVTTSNRGKIPIEELDPEQDKVIPFCRDQRTILVRGRTFRLGSRPYTGKMISLKTESASHDCTPDHKCFVKWDIDKVKGAFAVYLMQRGEDFRIGKAKLILDSKTKNTHHSGLALRAREEQADKLWVLGVYHTNTEALLAEERFSVSCGIPKACFIASDQRKRKWKGLYKWITQERLDKYFESVRRPLCHYARILEDLGRSIHFPLWERSEDKKVNTPIGCMSQIFTTTASNIVSGYMRVLVADEWKPGHGRKTPRTELVETSVYNYDGVVFSLGVDDHPSYIANDIVTHNCLVELNVIEALYRRYTEEFQIAPGDFAQMSLLDDLVTTEIMLKRALNSVADPRLKERYFLEKRQMEIEDIPFSEFQDGLVVTTSQTDYGQAYEMKVHPGIELVDKLMNKKQRILTLLVGTPQEQYKRDAALKQRSERDASQAITDAREKINKVLESEMFKKLSDKYTD